MPVGPGRVTLTAVGCARGGGSGVMQSEFIVTEPEAATGLGARAPPPPSLPAEELEQLLHDVSLGAAPAARAPDPNLEPEIARITTNDDCAADPAATGAPVGEGTCDSTTTGLEASGLEGRAGPKVILQPGVAAHGATLVTLVDAAADCMCYTLDGSAPVCGPGGWTCAQGIAGYGGVASVVVPTRQLSVRAVACSAPDPTGIPVEVLLEEPWQPPVGPAAALGLLLAASVGVHWLVWLVVRGRGPARAASETPAPTAARRPKEEAAREGSTGTVDRLVRELRTVKELLRQDAAQRRERESEAAQQLGQLGERLEEQAKQLQQTIKAPEGSGVWDDPVPADKPRTPPPIARPEPRPM